MTGKEQSFARKIPTAVGQIKNFKNDYGYKSHIDVDVKHKFIRKSKVTTVSIRYS